MSPRRKPASPEKIAAIAAERRLAEKVADRNPEAWGANVEAMAMPANASVAVTMDRARAKTVQTAKRMDAFSALATGMPQASYFAALRLQVDITIRKGEQDRGRNFNRVDCESPTDRTDAMIAAARRIEAVFARIGGHTQWLLTELASPSEVTRLQHQNWREIVAYITGETNPMAQGATVKHACQDLALAYAEMDREPRRVKA